MKRLFRFLTLTVLFAIASCTAPDDGENILDNIDQKRLAVLMHLSDHMNNNIESLHAIADAMQNNDYVTDVTTIKNFGMIVGYTIKFAKSESVTIFTGEEEDKTDYVPVFGIKPHDDGVYCWTIDGEWLMFDEDIVIAQTIEGQETVVPQIKLDDFYWYISLDSGLTWIKHKIAIGEERKIFIDKIVQEEQIVNIVLTDGTELCFPKGKSLDISFIGTERYVVFKNSSHSVDYQVISSVEPITIEISSSKDIVAKIQANDSSGMSGKIIFETADTIDDNSEVRLLVTNGFKVITRTIKFEAANLVIEDGALKKLSSEGGKLNIEYLTNVDCEVVIPEDAKSWLSIEPHSRVLEKRNVVLSVAPNGGYYREANIIIQSTSPGGKLQLPYQILQLGEQGYEISNNEILYTTTNGRVISKTSNSDFADKFNAPIVSNTYQNGIGRIVFGEPLTEIKNYAFFEQETLSTVYLPATITAIGSNAFGSCINLENVYIYSDRLSQIGSNSEPFQDNPFLGCIKLHKMFGPHISADGRCLIVDNVLYSFAGYGLDEYVTPEGVKAIASNAFGITAWGGHTLKSIIISEGVEVIDDDAFWSHPEVNYSLLEHVFLPSTLQHLGTYVFANNRNIKKFYGDSRFVSQDGYSLKNVYNGGGHGTTCLVAYANGSGLTSYSIPDGIENVDPYTFDNQDLKEITFPGTIREVSCTSLNRCYNIEKIYGPRVLDDNRSLVVGNKLLYVATKGLKDYTTPKGVTILDWGLFLYKQDLETLVISDDVREVDTYLTGVSSNIKTLTVSARMERLEHDPFAVNAVQTIYMRAPIPPQVKLSHKMNPSSTIYVPRESYDEYVASPQWELYRENFKPYDYGDLSEFYPSDYISSDYTQDGVVVTLQTATKGDGIDIVLMGDAYSDRQIADGTYRADMEKLYNNLFTEEPYKSFKDHFNVYYVNIVSAAEGYGYGTTALDGYVIRGPLAVQVGANDSAVFNYALNAISEEKMDEALLIVAMNSYEYGGVCTMYFPTTNGGDYGNGPSISYITTGGVAPAVASHVHILACGYGFAKLALEYADEDMGTIPDDEVNTLMDQQLDWGWWKNVDFTNDPTSIRWSRFINDARYANEAVGAYEGGLTYWSGVWRPTENSIMRYNTGGFNAPSREAIYYRIHKLAYGDSWEYDYEEFVKWDACNRAEAQRRSAARKPANYRPTHPPVIMNKTWKDATR